MKETRFRPEPKQPYGLHDKSITKMQMTGDTLELTFEDGFTELSGAYDDVQGSISIEGVDFDFATIIIQGRGGKLGGFRGEKLTIPEFVEKYKDFRFEVIYEYYGGRRLEYTGWLWMPDRSPKDMTLSLGYFTGDIVYYTEENS